MSKFDSYGLSLLELKILWSISGRPKHAYALLKELNNERKGRLTNGTLYPAIKKLSRADLVKAKKEGSREKKTFTITPIGKKALAQNAMEFCRAYDEIFSQYKCSICGKEMKGAKEKKERKAKRGKN